MSLYYAIFAAALTPSLASGLQNKTVVIKQRIRSELGKYLRGHVFKTTTQAADPQHCWRIVGQRMIDVRVSIIWSI
jgi:hypothetical protein